MRVLGDDFPSVLAASQRGDDDAFVRLWRSNQPHVVRYLSVLVGDYADDVASETWIAVMRGLPNFAGDESAFRRWLFAIARHRAVDWARARDRNPAVLTSNGEVPLGDWISDDAASEAVRRLSAREAARLIGELLPPLQAEAVVLRAVVGLDVADTAAVMDKRPATVRVLTHRGLRQLARKLQQQTVQELG